MYRPLRPKLIINVPSSPFHGLIQAVNVRVKMAIVNNLFFIHTPCLFADVRKKGVSASKW